MSNENLYKKVTNEIIKRLNNGFVPWKKPFQSGGAVSWNTQKPYRGINTLLLDAGEWATFNQIKKAGGTVKKGEKSSICVFWKLFEKEDKETGEKENIPLLRYYLVFEINSQVEGLESKRNIEEYNHNPIEEAENIINGYMGKPSISWETKGAWYMPSMDYVNIPPMKDFNNVEGYYMTFFHELIHSTGHKSRLNRDGVMGIHRFGSEDYSKEELVAELGASMLAAICGIDNTTIDNSASYIQSWIRALENDHKLIISASQRAQKGVDLILGTKFEEK